MTEGLCYIIFCAVVIISLLLAAKSSCKRERRRIREWKNGRID